ncbi:MAG: pyridoxal phosphate-dependent aminotransferase, partial [Gammaproteobacteria bacterium]|nr:pyridoxal phosphate-dependent aminotransferase [Gammaproteobacteria bacterium]
MNALDDLARNPHRLARRLAAVKPSPTIAVSNRARELRAAGHDVIGLGAGEPDFDTPDHIKEAAIEAIRAGATKYTAADGTPELKAAIAAKLKRDNDFEYSAAEIIASSGAKHSIFNVLLALLNPLDEVIIPAPYWVSYPDMVRLVDAVPIIVTAGLEQGFKVTAEQIERAITAKTRLLILNSPNNPSGACYSAQELIEIGDVLVRHPQVIVLSDDIYEHVLWSGEPFVNVLNACPQLRDQVIVVNGVSKAYAMTGWRIGYAAAP